MDMSFTRATDFLFARFYYYFRMHLLPIIMSLLLLRIQPDTPINDQSAASTEYAENFHVDNNNNNMYFRTAAVRQPSSSRLFTNRQR